MKSLTREQVLEEKQTHDAASIKELSIGHRALSDVSCLSEFRNLEKLDLRFNNLTSLEGLKSCVNLKSLMLIQNKLQSLNGIEGLSNLTVLNAGKNKLKSMDEVCSLVNLRALILNDNEISSICKLDQLKDLNTLVYRIICPARTLRIFPVLSRNPINEISDSLAKMKNLSKISLSNCRIHIIGSSLKSCTELKELRLAHNEIKTLPAELAFNQKLLTLDLGNNVIIKWSDLKVLGSLVNLRNLNLHGNPITENEKLAKKVRKLLPTLRIFNARPLDKALTNEKRVQVDVGDDHPSDFLLNKSEQVKEDHRGKKSSRSNIVGKSRAGKNHDTGNDICTEKGTEQKQKKGNEKPSGDGGAVQKKPKRARPKELDVIDDAETSFAEMFSRNYPSESSGNEGEKKSRDAQETGLAISVVPQLSKKKKTGKNQKPSAVAESLPEAEIGMGGESTWE